MADIRGYNVDRLINQGNNIASLDVAHTLVPIRSCPGLEESRTLLPYDHITTRQNVGRALRDLQATGANLPVQAPPAVPAAPGQGQPCAAAPSPTGAASARACARWACSRTRAGASAVDA